MIRGIIFDFNRTIFDPEIPGLSRGAIELLEKLKTSGYKMCLISKASSIERKNEISELGLDKYFIDIQVIVEGHKTEQHFERCIELMSLKPNEIAVVGDRIKKEIYLGNKFGMTTFWYKSGKSSNELPKNEDEIPKYTISKLEEILEYL